MTDINVSVRVRAVLLAALTACAACGGGGGGGGGGTVVGGVSPPPPPPPPPPVAPPPPAAPVVTARAVASATSVQEGQPFKLDASTSSEAGGAALTYAWTQVSGPAVTIASPGSAELNLNAAEVTADTKAEFRVTATSGAASSTATVEVTFTNIAQTPVFLKLDLAASALFNATYPFSIAMIVGNWTYGLVGTMPAAGGPITFTQVEVAGPSPATPSTLAPFSETFTQPAKFNLSQTRPQSPTLDFSRPWFTVAEETANRYRVYEKTPGGSYGAPIQDISITRPCEIEYGYVGSSASFTTHVYVGQRERGFTRLSDTGTVIQEMNTGQSLCAMASVRGPINSNGSSFVGGTPGLPDLVAIDTTANTVNHFGPSLTDPTQYVLKSQAPLRLLSSSSSLKFVAATRMYNTNQYGTWQSIAGLAVIYSDGQHQGEHRLVLVGLDPNRIIRQDTRTWTLGVPSDVIFDDLDDDNVPEVIVISSTSPQAMVYESDSSFRPTIPIAVSATPSFVEIGLGATKALPRMSNVMTLMGLFVAYRDKNEVKLFYPPD